MCGIAGFIGRAPIPQGYEFGKVLDKIKHRGPDASGSMIFNQNKGMLGHTRLSIQDLSDASVQPFQRDQLTVTFNGEIYNFKELREELSSYGYRFATTGDTEVVLAAYQHWDIECFNRFNGMWAM
ncbi:uncharacterized protein TRIADDRAFT_34900, partial [Trichoplax adhaerens]